MPWSLFCLGATLCPPCAGFCKCSRLFNAYTYFNALETHLNQDTGIGSVKVLHTTDSGLVYILYANQGLA
jgi:hypothetical protein